MGDISRNFNRSEFACKCECGFDDIDTSLVAVLQVIRDAAGVPITITSGCRCPSYNASPDVGGVKSSQHLKGKAADFRIEGKSAAETMALVKQLYREGRISIGYAYAVTPRVVHIDVRFPVSATVRGWRQG